MSRGRILLRSIAGLLAAVCLLAGGCGLTKVPAVEPKGGVAALPSTSAQEAPTKAVQAVGVGALTSAEAGAPNEVDPPAKTTNGPEPAKGLWTRKSGVDWQSFLGTNGDSKSPEKGILKKWPASGLKAVWEKPLGTS